MKKFVLLLYIILSAFYINQCKSPEITSLWTEEDNFLTEKCISDHDLSIQYLEDIDASLALFNNAEYLYIILSSYDVFINRQIRMRGLTVWFNDSNKKQKLYGVRHGGRNRLGENFQIRDSFWQSLTSEQKERLEQRQQEIHRMITVIDSGNKRQIPPDNPTGPAVSHTFHGKEYNLVFRIPIEKLISSPMRSVMMGLELGSADGKELRRMDSPMGSMPDGAPMAGGGIGRPGGGMNKPKAESRRFVQKEIWLRVHFAKQS